jgi:outer membrane receptor for ferrienterochelin and colicins
MRHILCFLMFFLTTAAAQAQPVATPPDSTKKAIDLSGLVVTATRTVRPAADLPVPTQIISAEKIQKAGVSRLNEIINEQTGLTTVPTFGGGEGIQIQGLDAAYTLILIDGQPLVGRSAGTLDLSRISINNIEKIEIVKGASSSLYGSEALAGVVNIITKKPTTNEPPNATITYKRANFETNDASININAGKNKISTQNSLNYFTSGGYDLGNPNDFVQTVEPYKNLTAHTKIQYEANKKNTLTASARYYTQLQDYKALIFDNEYGGKSNINEANLNAKLTHIINPKAELNTDLYTTYYQANQYLNNLRTTEPFEKTYYKQWIYRPEMRLNLRLRQTDQLTIGAGINRETLDRTYFEKKATIDAQFIYTQYEWFIKKKCNILAGFRFDNTKQYQAQLSPKLAVNFKASPSLSIKSSVGYGFKAPDLRQLYFDFSNSAVGYTVLGYNVATARLAALDAQGQILSYRTGFDFTKPLRPESSINYNIGGFFKKNKLTANANIFFNTINNLIDTRIIAQKTNGQSVFSYFNIDKIYTTGIELNADYALNQNINLSAGYQYLMAKDYGTIDKINSRTVFARNPETLVSFVLSKNDYFGLFNRSKHNANIKLNYTIPKLNSDANIRIIYKSKYGIFDTNGNQILDDYDEFIQGYFLINVGASTQIKQKITLQIGANNLLNFTNPDYITNIAGIQIFGILQYKITNKTKNN